MKGRVLFSVLVWFASSSVAYAQEKELKQQVEKAVELTAKTAKLVDDKVDSSFYNRLEFEAERQEFYKARAKRQGLDLSKSNGQPINLVKKSKQADALLTKIDEELISRDRKSILKPGYSFITSIEPKTLNIGVGTLNLIRFDGERIVKVNHQDPAKEQNDVEVKIDETTGAVFAYLPHDLKNVISTIFIITNKQRIYQLNLVGKDVPAQMHNLQYNDVSTKNSFDKTDVLEVVDATQRLMLATREVRPKEYVVENDSLAIAVISETRVGVLNGLIIEVQNRSKDKFIDLTEEQIFSGEVLAVAYQKEFIEEGKSARMIVVREVVRNHG